MYIREITERVSEYLGYFASAKEAGRSWVKSVWLGFGFGVGVGDG